MRSIRDVASTAGTVFTGTGLLVLVSIVFVSIAGAALASVALVLWLAFAMSAKF